MRKEKARAKKKKAKQRLKRREKRLELRRQLRLAQGLDPEDPPGFESSTSETSLRYRKQKSADTKWKRFKRIILRKPDPPEVIAKRAEADKNFAQIMVMKKQGLDPFKDKNIIEDTPDSESDESSSSYVSTTDSDERRKANYHKRMRKTKDRLDKEIGELRKRRATVQKTNDQLRDDIKALRDASVDLRRVNTGAYAACFPATLLRAQV